MITSDHVHELVDSGSTQIGPQYMPPNFTEFLFAVTNEDYAHGHCSMARIERVFPDFRAITDAVI